MKKILITIFVCLFSCASFSQSLSSKDKKALKMYSAALDWTNKTNYSEAENLLKQCIKRDSLFAEAYFLLGDIYFFQKRKEENIAIRKLSVKKVGKFNPLAYYYYALDMAETGEYQTALNLFSSVYSNKGYFTDEEMKTTNDNVKMCNYRIDMMNNPVPFKPINLGNVVNTEWDDYKPSLIADESYIIVTSLIPQKQEYYKQYGEQMQEDMFIISNKDGNWSDRQSLQGQINTPGNEGAHTVVADGSAFFFTACDRQGSYGRCDIYYSYKNGKQWTKPSNSGPPVSTSYWDSQPALSADGREIFFVSNRPGSIGGADIWTCKLTNDGKWGKAQNLGSVINTSSDENSPFLHPDNITLYFTSKGHMGMGGSDIFKTTRQPDGSWGEPINLGYPLNTEFDETDFIVNAAGNTAYFASDRFEGIGGSDVYKFELYEAARPVKVTWAKGKIYDADTKKPLNAMFELIDLNTSELVIQSFSDPVSGEFLITLPANKDYAMNVSRNAYLFFSENFSFKETDITQAYNFDIALVPIKVGGKTVLNNVFFDVDSYELKSQSKIELGKLSEFLKSNTGVKIELSGHTDNTGSPSKNLTLSQNRAKAVYDYMLTLGIEPSRMSYKGYGANRPVVKNDSEKNKALNRRTEFEIIKIE